MRQAIINGIKALALGTFSVTEELPWDSAGTPLYRKNFKVFYVDEPDSVEETLMNTLSASVLASKTTTISVFVLVDAKQQPPNYDALVEGVRDVKNTPEITAVRSRECDIVTTFEGPAMLTEFVFRFTEMKIN